MTRSDRSPGVQGAMPPLARDFFTTNNANHTNKKQSDSYCERSRCSRLPARIDLMLYSSLSSFVSFVLFVVLVRASNNL